MSPRRFFCWQLAGAVGIMGFTGCVYAWIETGKVSAGVASAVALLIGSVGQAKCTLAYWDAKAMTDVDEVEAR
jgi:hypothetical protein